MDIKSKLEESTEVALLEIPKLKIFPCEGNVSGVEGNNCGIKDALLKDDEKDPSGNHRCWASLNNKEDELWKVSKELFESDALINRKIKAALANEIIPIFCVGEELAIRESGAHVSHVIRQVRAGLEGFTKPELKKIVIAYEPVWAIGTGKVATPEDAQEVCAAIREEIENIGSPEIAANMRILYGGSVKSSNIVEIMKKVDVDGALIGGASLDPEELAKIVKFHAVSE